MFSNLAIKCKFSQNWKTMNIGMYIPHQFLKISKNSGGVLIYIFLPNALANSINKFSKIMKKFSKLLIATSR